MHVEKFFARNLGGLIHARTRVPGRLGKATSRTHVDEKSDSDTEPKCRVDPNDGCASDESVTKSFIARRQNPREEPGALAAHAGI